MNPMQRFINQLIPFLLIGVAIVAFAFGVFLMAYLFLFGALVGLALFIANWIRNKFFLPKKNLVKPAKKRTGQIIDSKDWHEL